MGDSPGYCCAGVIIIALLVFLGYLGYLAVVNIGPYVVTFFGIALLIILLIGIIVGVIAGLFAYWKSFKKHVFDDDGTDNLTPANEAVAIIVVIAFVICCVFTGVIVYDKCSDLEIGDKLSNVNFGSRIEDYNIFNVIDTIKLVQSNLNQKDINYPQASTTLGMLSYPDLPAQTVYQPTPVSTSYGSQNNRQYVVLDEMGNPITDDLFVPRRK